MEFRQGLPIGSIVGGDYRIIDVLGQGGFGLTYRGFDTRLGSAVAIKEYFPAEMALREDGTSVRVRSAREESVFGWGREKFLDEAKTLARFRHNNIVRVARLFEENNTAYMVLDFEQGPSLAQWRADLGRPPRQDELDRIASQLLEAVEVVHKGGILHRDIKPQNVIMRGGVEPVLIDFGAARQSLGQRSKTVHAIVTPGYSPKEQYALDVDRQGPWSDIYALGATFYFLVTGHSPPDALTRDLEQAMPMETDGQEPYRESFLLAIDTAMSIRAEDRPQNIDAWRPMLFSEARTVTSLVRPPRHGATGTRTELAAPPSRRASTRARSTATEPPEPPPRAASRPVVRNVTFDELQPAQPPAQRSSRAGTILGAVAAVAAIAGGIWYYVLVFQPERDEAAWRAATAADTVQAYDAYLSSQPNGRFAPDARLRRQRLAAAVPGPVPPVAGQPVPPTPQPPLQQQPVPAPPQPNPLPQPDAPPGPAPGRAAGPLPPRTHPGPLPPSEVDRLAQNVAQARWRLVPLSLQRVRGFGEQHTDFSTELDQLSRGRLTFTAVAPDEIGGSQNILREVRAQADLMGWHAPTLSLSRRRAYAIFAGNIPFGLAPADHVRWMRSEGARLLEQLYARDNWHFRAIPCGIAGGPGGWYRREIRSPNDFRGLKVRANALASEVLQRLGATPVAVQNTELPAAFAANTVDAMLAVTAFVQTFTRTPPPAAVYHFPSWHSPSYLFDLLISSNLWLAMSPAQQQLVDEACRRNLDKWATQFESTQTEVLTQVRNARIAIRPHTGPTLEALRRAADEVLAEEAARSAEFKEVLDSYNRFRR